MRHFILAIVVLSWACGETESHVDDDGADSGARQPTQKIPSTATGHDAGSIDAGQPSVPIDPIIPDAGILDAGTPVDPETIALPSFSLMTYNVAGLPAWISGSGTREATLLMSPQLNPYDIVAVQEDFSYHEELISQDHHPHKSTPKSSPGIDIGDGLNFMANYAFPASVRVKWDACNGVFGNKSDCLTDKGLFGARFEFAPGVTVDIYNIHMDAGRDGDDEKARRKQVLQLLSNINLNSTGQPVIVVGDTNLKTDKSTVDQEVLQTLLFGAGLTDACRSLGCAEPERIDRIMYRSSANVTLRAKTWQKETHFVDAAGNPLSDHLPVKVQFEGSYRRP